MSMGFSAPSWIEVIASLLLVAVSAAVAYLQRLGLTRELPVAAVRAGVQLVAVGAVLGLIFARGGLASGFGWVIVMVVIAGQVARLAEHALFDNAHRLVPLRETPGEAR
jgi:putative ABC transport system permease protein